MKLWKVNIKTYYFGNTSYTLFVLADTEDNARETIYKYPPYHKDEDAEIESITEIDLNDTTNRVI